MKLLITGATGLVGNELVKMALKQGMIIHYLTTHKSKTKKIIGAHGFYWNPSLQEIDFRGNKLSELSESLFSLPKLQHLDISDNPFTELPFVKNNALKTLKIARTPFGIFKSNILKTKQFYANCEVEEAVKYADDKTLYLSATKKYYSSIHPSGYHSYH